MQQIDLGEYSLILLVLMVIQSKRCCCDSSEACPAELSGLASIDCRQS